MDMLRSLQAEIAALKNELNQLKEQLTSETEQAQQGGSEGNECQALQYSDQK
jgi:hypothetical protein